MVQLAPAAAGDVLVPQTELLDLVASKIELIEEYKLEYPQDYDVTDLRAMQQELERLRMLLDGLQTRTTTGSRSEERRVGKEGRSGGATECCKQRQRS